MQLFHGNCLDEMSHIADNSVDLICTDLPYGVTNCDWDEVIPFNRFVIEKNKVLYWEDFLIRECKKNMPYKEILSQWNEISNLGMWDHFNRIIKERGAVLLFGMQPFSSLLVASNLKHFRYEIIYEKGSAKGFLNAKRRPLNAHENILVFYKRLSTYNFIKTTGHPRQTAKRHDIGCDVYGKTLKINNYDSTERYPRSVQFYSADTHLSSIHPNQKPVDLMEWLIKTYSNEGDVVLDACMGSGSTGVASLNLKRKFIGIEQDPIYFLKAKKRLESIQNILIKQGFVPSLKVMEKNLVKADSSNQLDLLEAMKC